LICEPSVTSTTGIEDLDVELTEEDLAVLVTDMHVASEIR
jgi:hypothetical protein